MKSLPDGMVWLALEIDLDEGVQSRWGGYFDSNDKSVPEESPEFADAADAVQYWRERGATNICIRLDNTEYLWAGVGLPPEECALLPIFDPNDPRGRPEGTKKTTVTFHREMNEHMKADEVARVRAEGEALTRRREAMGLSVADLAERVGKTPEWLLTVEGGKLTEDVTMGEWLDLVWATREGWPDERASAGERQFRWSAPQGQFLHEAESIIANLLRRHD
jgi:hypothetical protein